MVERKKPAPIPVSAGGASAHGGMSVEDGRVKVIIYMAEPVSLVVFMRGGNKTVQADWVNWVVGMCIAVIAVWRVR